MFMKITYEDIAYDKHLFLSNAWGLNPSSRRSAWRVFAYNKAATEALGSRARVNQRSFNIKS